ncbi:BBSome complex assembly protein BBS10 isoform 2-T2 [Anomaloglossus baeobatrachus]|uniref:BBSome complex assembly protein BBS10 isoform X1 n=2 Tax=Anomaloglossus baeobatrachus TaxID=238106 RepID=UPI003F508173
MIMAEEAAQMQRHTEHLDISKILQVAESLENILRGCFGPEGGQVLFIKSTGEILITKDGRRILESLLLDHPVARMIVNSASRHYSITGDGVKSFVLLLCAVLRELQATANKNEDLLLSGKTTLKNQYQRQGHALRRLSNLLLTFHSRVLDHIIATHLSPYFLSVFKHMEGNITLCRVSVQQILDTYFSGRIGCNLREFISKLACEFLFRCFLHIDDIPSVVSLVNTHFYELLTEVSGLPVADSRILPGLLLHRTFSVYCPAEGEVRALIVTEQLNQSLSDTDIGFLVSSSHQLQQSQLFLNRRIESVLRQLQHKEVKVIFSSVKQHEIVLYYAKLSGISIVECLPSEEIDLLCMITGASKMSGPLNEHLQTETFPIASCKPIVIGCKKYVQLVFQSSLPFRPHSLVLCGPVKGLIEQLVSSFHGAFKMLTQLFHPFTAIQEQPPNHADRYFPERAILTKEQSGTCKGCQNDSVGVKCHLENTDRAMHIVLTMSEEKNLASASCSANLSPSYRCGDTINEIRKPDQEPFINHGDSSNITDLTGTVPFANIGLVFPSTGVFELLLKDYLHKFAKTCQDAELASICTLFGNAFLCIPRQFYKAKTGHVHLPLNYLQCTQKMKHIDTLNIAETGLEPVSCKYQLLASVVQCISQLVTIDLIVRVKRSPSAPSDETDQDMLMEDH